MPSLRAACSSTRNSFWNSGICAGIRCTWRVAPPRRTLTATHDLVSALALGRIVTPRGLPWRESGDGLAVRGRAWLAEEERGGGVAIARTHCDRPFRGDWAGGGRGGVCGGGAAFALRQDRRRWHSPGLRNLPVDAQKPSSLGRDADWFSGSLHLVVSDGFCARGRVHAAAENQSASRPNEDG